MSDIVPGSKPKKATRKRGKRAPDATETPVPERAIDPTKQSSRHLQPRTAEDIANEQTAEQLALRIWAAVVAQNALSAMSALIDELIQSHLLDDDDEDADESGLDADKKREKEIFDEAIADALDRHPDFNSVNELPPNSDSDVARDAEQLKNALAKCAIGATKFRERFPRAQLIRMVKRDLEILFKKDPRYREHAREDVPGSDVKAYGSRGRTSSKGTFARADYDGLVALLTGRWIRVAKDRIDPVAWSHRFGLERNTESQRWRHHFLITARNGQQSSFWFSREDLAGNGQPALRALMRAGARIVWREGVRKALVQFLHFKPQCEIIRMPRVGWAKVGSRWIFVRPDEVIAAPGMSATKNVKYELDATAIRHGLHVAGTTAAWAAEIAEPLRGNSNIALAFATFFAAPLLRWASEPGGGNHFCGKSSIGKTMASAFGQSIYGWPHELADDTVGVTWAGSEAGFDAFALARSDIGLALDEITRAKRNTAEQVVYTLASGVKGPRATSSGGLRETAHANVLVLSTGERSLVEFIGTSLQEGARKRLADVPAEVQAGSAFEKISSDRIHSASKPLFDAMKRQHGAVGRDWQRYLVGLGPDQIKAQLSQHRKAFLALAEVHAVDKKAHPQVRAVVNRFALFAAALRMAIAAKLLPWTNEETDAGIVACMGRWVAQRGNLDTAGEIVRAAQQVERELVRGLADRFIHIDEIDRKWVPISEDDKFRQRTPELFDGYAKPDRILVNPEAWRRRCNGFNPSDIARQFEQRGVLIVGGGGKMSRAEQVVGGTHRFYVLVRSKLQHSNTPTPET